MAAKVTPSTPGAPSLSSASAYALRSVSILQTWTYKPQKRQDVSDFALTYSLRLRSCKSLDAFIISSLPSRLKETLQTAGPLRSTDITPLHRYYWPARHPLVLADFPVSPVIRPTLLRRFLAGTRRVSPVTQHVLVTVLSLSPRRGGDAASVRFRHPMLPSPSGSG